MHLCWATCTFCISCLGMHQQMGSCESTRSRSATWPPIVLTQLVTVSIAERGQGRLHLPGKPDHRLIKVAQRPCLDMLKQLRRKLPHLAVWGPMSGLPLGQSSASGFPSPPHCRRRSRQSARCLASRGSQATVPTCHAADQPLAWAWVSIMLLSNPADAAWQRPAHKSMNRNESQCALQHDREHNTLKLQW